jgi:hypothetical protein
VASQNERDSEDLRPSRETDAAAHEAGGVGGRAPADEDPARRPVDEAGGGQAEGFEQAEEDLRENAEHGQLGPRDPRRDAFTAEEETDVAAPAYGDADHERSSERTGET